MQLRRLTGVACGVQALHAGSWRVFQMVVSAQRRIYVLNLWRRSRVKRHTKSVVAAARSIPVGERMQIFGELCSVHPPRHIMHPRLHRALTVTAGDARRDVSKAIARITDSKPHDAVCDVRAKVARESSHGASLRAYGASASLRRFAPRQSRWDDVSGWFNTRNVAFLEPRTLIHLA